MANYGISGVWKDKKGVITHYAIHVLDEDTNTLYRATKTTKEGAIRLLSNSENSAITILWNYKKEEWETGETVSIVGSGSDRYLRSTHDKTDRNNLAHLINYDFVTLDFRQL